MSATSFWPRQKTNASKVVTVRQGIFRYIVIRQLAQLQLLHKMNGIKGQKTQLPAMEKSSITHPEPLIYKK